MAREAWTDERLDDLNRKVEDGFKELRGELKTVRTELKGEIRGVRAELKEEIRGVRAEMTEIRTEMGAINRALHQFTFAVVGTVFLGFMGTIAALFSVAA